MHLQDVFQIGERVRCLVMGMDDNFTRISLSTAELEENEGDIMFEKVLSAPPLLHGRPNCFLVFPNVNLQTLPGILESAGTLCTSACDRLSLEHHVLLCV